MASISVTITTTSDMSWEELKHAADVAGVPEDAKFKLHEHKSYNPVDHDEEKIVFTWTVNTG